jgi:hypothetical protein
MIVCLYYFKVLSIIEFIEKSNKLFLEDYF